MPGKAHCCCFAKVASSLLIENDFLKESPGPFQRVLVLAVKDVERLVAGVNCFDQRQ